MFLKIRNKTGAPLDRTARLYLAVKFFSTLYFTYPIFYEYASQAITPVQVGLFFSTIGVFGLIAEIPTSIIADKYSRKFCALAGMPLLLVAPLIVFFGHDFSAYMLAALFYGLGRAFLSGTLEAMVYDHANVTKAAYRRVNAYEITYGQAGILASAAVGGMLFSFNAALPFMVEAFTGFLCVVLIFFMQERYKDGHVKSTATHRQHFFRSVSYLMETTFLRVIVLMGVIFSVMLGMCIQFVNEAAMIEYGFEATTRGFIVSGAGIVVLAILNLFLLKILKTDIARVAYMGFGAVLTYGILSVPIVPLFLVGYIFWCCLNATSSFLRVIIQDQIPASHRSTILSNFKTLAILVGLGASTATGLLVQWAGTPRGAYMVFAAIALAILLPCTYWLIRHLKNESTRAIA